MITINIEKLKMIEEDNYLDLIFIARSPFFLLYFGGAEICGAPSSFLLRLACQR